jgi:hypothetical protein
MKKIMTLAILFVAGAGSVFAQPQLQITDLFPLKVGTVTGHGNRWTYLASNPSAEGPAKDEAKKIVVVEVEREEVYQKSVGFILKMTSGGKTTRDHVVVLPDGVHRVHAAGTPINPPLCFFKLGPAAGLGWQADSKSGNTTIKGNFTVKQIAVTVPGGKFDKAFLISFTNEKNGEERVEIDNWYVSGIGMVRQRVKAKGHEIVLELEKYEPAK